MPDSTRRPGPGHAHQPSSHRPLAGAGRPTARASTIVSLAGLALVASGLFSPIVAAAPVAAQTGTSRAGAAPAAGQPAAALAAARVTRQAIGRSVGAGISVDPRRAAREAVAAPRPSVRTARLRVDLGARRATPLPLSTTPNAANLAGSKAATSTGGAALVTQPAPVITTQFPGIAQAEACTCEPPDPWIAVSATYVVQTTNGLVRIDNRSGTTLLSMPTWALFAVPVDRFDSDPRILWDQVHGRWIGVLTTYRGDFSASGLRLAVSETADPTAGWIVYAIEYGGGIPDYPGISSSATRIVLTSDDFRDASTFLGPTWIEMDWSNILAGTDLYIGGVSYRAAAGNPPPAFGHFRPAITLSPVLNTPVIYEDGDSPGYFEIAGGAHSPPPAQNVHLLTTEFGLEKFSLPPVPVQPGAVSIANAADERPTDAVYRSGSLWFTSTADYNDGSAHWSSARWTQVLTTANGLDLTGAKDYIAATSGTHYVMPGVGINGRGSAIMAVTAMDPIAMNPTTVVGGLMAGSIAPTPLVAIETSPAAYIGDRWGDFLGIAADPSGAGSVWLAHELSDADGKWRTSVVRIVSDGTPPGAPGPTSQVPLIPATLGSTVPIRVSWGAAPDIDSGITSYLVERSDDGGAFFGVSIPGTSITQPLLFGHTVRYRITPTDVVGLVGPPTYSPTFYPVLTQSTSSTTLTGTWGTTFNTGFSGGTARYSTRAGASATFTATFARSIAIVTTKAATRGSFRVYVDGIYRGTISTYSAVTRFRQLVYQFSWPTRGTHKVKIVVVGTAGRPRVDLDAFVVLR